MATDPICGMTVDEKTGLKIKHNGKYVYFCSQNCLIKYQKENKLKVNKVSKEPACSSCSPTPKGSLIKNKLFLISLLFIALDVSGLFVPFLAPLRVTLNMYLMKIALPVLLGLVIGGVIDWLVPREYISYLLAGQKKRTLLTAVSTGFLMSVCSHGILALTIQLYKKGASVPAVLTFLLASPWANLPVTFLMFGFFGWKAFVIIISAMVIAIAAGLIFMLLSKLNLVEHNPNTVKVPKGFLIRKDIVKRFAKARFNGMTIRQGIQSIWQGSLALADMVLWWILLGALLSSIAGAYLPAHFMHQYMGASFAGLMVTLLVATVMEICSEGTAPLAFEIYRQTGALGNAFVFLMAGVVTDYTEIGLLWINVGRRTALWMVGVTVPMVVILGYIFNKIL